jgi:magnesium transporter
LRSRENYAGSSAWRTCWRPGATLLGFGDPRLAAAVAISLVFASAVAASIGLLLPWFLQRLGRDPAFGSGPVATIIQDVLSLLIYFVTVGALLK